MAKTSVRQFLQPVGDPSNPDGLYCCMVRYIEHIRSRGYTTQTLWGHERYLRNFLAWCDQNQLKTPGNISKDDLEHYLLDLQAHRTRLGRPLAWHSKQAKLVPVRSFFHWLLESEVLPNDPSASVSLMRRPNPAPRSIPSNEDINRILAQPDTSTPIGLRDRAMLEVLFSTGLRRMELTALRIDQVDFDAKTIHVRQGKFGKDRLLPVTDRTLEWIKRYIDQVRGRVGSEDVLFLTQNGEPFNMSWLSNVIGAHIRSALPGRRGACHLLRHFMATSMLQNGADIRYIQVMLGHSQLSSTQIYTQISMPDLKAVYERTHPGSHLRARASCAELTPSSHQSKPSNASAAIASQTCEAMTPFQEKILHAIRLLPASADWLDLISLVSALALRESIAVRSQSNQDES